ncbi:DEAD/DEAH box helicase [Streptococcus sp. zg-JUN1979]|uniref:DEAD/DEAH box helicase n=1 Tax=Streptococcus sp. zg-JUN1979 TaxID=3391450 RepID=UPI0039A7179E
MGLAFEDQLLDSMRFGFIDRTGFQNVTYAPKILINNAEEKRFVLTDLQEELLKSKAFYFSVAFVTQSGISMIKAQLADLAARGVKGKILISPYLDFNDPLAMYDLLKLPNVDVRLSQESMQLHSKYYLFEQDNKHVLIAGSSNLTATALKQNYEWNIKLNSADNGDIIYQTKQEFDRIWALSRPLTPRLIESYQTKRQSVIQVSTLEEEPRDVYQSRQIEPNKMQEEALEGLQQVRHKGEQRALVISATGTGKTYLSAFDVQQAQPDRVLFIVHREQILRKSLESFKHVLGFSDDEACIYKSGIDVSDKKYIFATIQTLSRDEHLQRFAPDFFDYILIDEVHKAGADSYQKVMAYFDPDFLLGMTATPERTDGQNIYEFFDYNIAYEIRLQDAMDADLLCPFHYFGVSDIVVDGQLISEDMNFSNFISEERVNHIVEKIGYYGHSGESVRGLMFCSSKKEASTLSVLLNQRGFKTQSLTGDDSQLVRDDAIQKLENGALDYILTVDIFNEGIDIPSINQVVMLRNTESSIIFVQQLGRGLRKHSSKDYVTIIDFIGNYRNNYLIPVALFGDQSMNKDNYRREVREPNLIQGLTTINFEEVARKHIFESITNTNLASIKLLRDHYSQLQNKLGRQPFLKDFIGYNSVDPLTFFDNNAFKDYADVVTRFGEEAISFEVLPKKFLSFITFECLNGKRKHELLLLQLLVNNGGQVDFDTYFECLIEHDLDISSAVIHSVERVLNLNFLKVQEVRKFGTEALVSKHNDVYYLHKQVVEELRSNKVYQAFFQDVIDTGLLKSEAYPQVFTLGQKYSRRDVLKLLNIQKDEPPINIGGYKIDVETNSCPIFITYHKSDDISDTIKYEDELLSESTLKWFSKSRRKLISSDVQTIMTSQENGLRLELFVIKDDSEGGEFYYLGPLNYIKKSAEELERAGESIVRMLFTLKEPVKSDLFHYLTTK